MPSSRLFSSEQTPPGEIERSLSKQGLQWLVGVDEAGRGALFGSVVAGAVVYAPGVAFPDGVADSKQLSASEREALESLIKGSAASWGVGSASAAEVDEVNILQATFLAMRRAVDACVAGLGRGVELVLVDGPHPVAGLSLAQKPIVKGDQRSLHIAAASILAKVARDREVSALEAVYPGYGLAKHKGYGTASHMEAIRRLGLSPLHRRTFCHDI